MKWVVRIWAGVLGAAALCAFALWAASYRAGAGRNELSVEISLPPDHVFAWLLTSAQRTGVELADVQPPHLLALRTSADDVTQEITYTVDAAGPGTRLTMLSQALYRSWTARLTEPLVTHAAQKRLFQDLLRLKAAVEKSS